jgi:hypothetical protein
VLLVTCSACTGGTRAERREFGPKDRYIVSLPTGATMQVSTEAAAKSIVRSYGGVYSLVKGAQ